MADTPSVTKPEEKKKLWGDEEPDQNESPLLTASTSAEVTSGTKAAASNEVANDLSSLVIEEHPGEGLDEPDDSNITAVSCQLMIRFFVSLFVVVSFCRRN